MLKTRALSALALAPPALLAAWYGGYPFALMVAIAAALMCWEWHRIACGGFGYAARAAALLCFAASLLAVSAPEMALYAVGGAVLVSVLLVCPVPGRRAWSGLGALYIGLPSLALVWLRGAPDHGAATVWWLLLVVWATDIGAYAFGRLIGGPLLMPRVSPKKTWAGLLGGMLCAALVGIGVAVAEQLSGVIWVAFASAILAVVAQAGDLLESWVKRRWGVKDSSNIIPGHGGVLDRVDGLLSAAITVAALTLVTGKAVLIWQ
ncbi:phosphatidate cytidylyltransferase [Magnetospirillum molischianum]|uniref:Phosphatidate cytidylyltransferase n=1 Tax=Magnetospirillum molischianum DSM 120 TaxID=1150626 RepID=H8FRA8_MAGML|nr:phosphatidate cytidylyltransferase [Magnetospirillum molischianum]CCG40896.1 Phosphatidate cytidylyltransferase [Magnetospirillum molischianum DSM 120]